MNFRNIILLCVILFMVYLLITNYFTINYQEGFNSFGSVNNYLEETIIPQYNATSIVYKIYDNIFYDKTNGNLIETVQLSNYSGGTNDGSGNSIAEILIISRNVDTNNPTFTSYDGLDSSGNIIYQNTLESLVNTINTNTTSWSYNTTTNYQVTYIPFGYETYIHVMNISTQSPTILISAYFTDPNQNDIDDYYLWTTNSNIGTPLGVTSGSYLGAPNNLDGANVTEPFYDNNAPLYQLSQYVKYDANNGNLCVEGRTSAGNKNITVYARNGNVTTYDVSNNATTLGGSTPSSQLSSLPTNLHTPMVINDALNTNIIVYWPVFSKTILMEYKGVVSSVNTGLVPVALACFTDSTLYVPGSSTTSGNDLSPPVADNGNDKFSMSEDALSNYYKWYWYWNKYGGEDTQTLTNDYLLKTSIVPPVCPSCPTCPACPALAGAGTGGGANPLMPPPNDGDLGDRINSVGQFAGNAINNTGQFAGNAINNTGQFAADAINNTGQFAGSAISNTASAGANAVGSVWNKLTTQNPTNVSPSYGVANVPPGGQSANGIYTGQQYIPDKYAYNGQMTTAAAANGQLQNIPDPLPVTADFSKFGR